MGTTLPSAADAPERGRMSARTRSHRETFSLDTLL